MDEKAYVIQVGTNYLLANDQDHAFKLIELISKAQPVDMKYVDNNYQILHANRLTISMEVRPLDDVDAEHL
ncbi:MAG: hypothetical protein ACR2PT_03155 [Endozoicomonas sp.]